MMWALMAPLIPLLRRRVPLGAVGAIDSRDATTLHSLGRRWVHFAITKKF
jgi:hypothetical protein